MPEDRRRKSMFGSALGVFAASVVITLGFWAALPSGMRGEPNVIYQDFYEPAARSILQGSGPILSNGMPAVRYPPGYPALLAGAEAVVQYAGLPDSQAPSLLSLLCVGLAASLIFLLAGDVWGVTGGWISAMMFATYPPWLWLTQQPNSEVPFAVFLTAAMYFFWRACRRNGNPWILVAAGSAAAGGAMLVRPFAVGLGAMLAALLVAAAPFGLRKRFLLVAVLLGANLALVAPWELWAHARTGAWIPLSTAGVSGVQDGLTYAVEAKGYRTNFRVPPDVRDLQVRLAAETSSIHDSGGLVEAVWQNARREPLAAFKMLLIKAARSWYGTDSGRLDMALLAIQIPYLAVLAASGVAFWHRHAEQRLLWFMLVGYLVYSWIVTIGVLSIARYMTPAIGLLFVLAPSILEAVRRRKKDQPPAL